ncbi:MAG: hypothetical protein V9E83_03800 [Baekduia sp.]
MSLIGVAFLADLGAASALTRRPGMHENRQHPRHEQRQRPAHPDPPRSAHATTIKPTDLRGILKYVPRFQGQTFVISADGIIVADENFSEPPRPTSPCSAASASRSSSSTASATRSRISPRSRNVPITDVQGTGVADAATLDLAIRASSRVTHLVIEGLTQNGLKAALTNAVRAAAPRHHQGRRSSVHRPASTGSTRISSPS